MNKTASYGLLITLEGIEGVGKSTQLSFVERYLRKKNIPVLVTREPGGTAIAEAIRHLVLHAEVTCDEPLAPEAELLLFFAARVQHIQQIIQPALLRGDWVICDRFVEASYAYQGGGRGIDPSFISSLQQWIQPVLTIDCVLWLDAPVSLVMQRIKHRRLDRIEAESTAFFERVRRVYQLRAEQKKAAYHHIDASRTKAEVQAQISQVLDQLIEHSGCIRHPPNNQLLSHGN